MRLIRPLEESLKACPKGRVPTCQLGVWMAVTAAGRITHMLHAGQWVRVRRRTRRASGFHRAPD